MTTKTTKYVCRQCSACCRWPGVVRVQPAEIADIAKLLDLTPEDFIERYTTLAPDRRGLVLVEQPDGACIFLADNKCRINSVKPIQCRAFPNDWNFQGFDKMCQAHKIN